MRVGGFWGWGWVAIWLSVAATASTGVAHARPLRIMSLDQCADQYVLALAPEADLALSPRADDTDAWLRRQAEGRRRIRPSLEAAVGFSPDVVVRYWGGEPKLLQALEGRGVRVLTINDAADFEQISANIRQVASGLNRSSRGDELDKAMWDRLASVKHRSNRQRPGAVYLTSGGFTSGPGTLMDAMMTAAGFRNLTETPGFGSLSVERIVLEPPVRVVLGFFDQVRADWRGPGRHPAVQKVTRRRSAASLPAAVLTCPAWFAADGVAMLAEPRS